MKLYGIGLRGALPIFIQSFFVDREWVGNSFSKLEDHLEGVPQGSVTPLALVINDIVKIIPNAVSCCLYVDDFILYSSGGTIQYMQGHMRTVVKVVQWATYHGFKFSPNMTMTMHFHKGFRDLLYPDWFSTPLRTADPLLGE
ncbi:uncharacterized protein [Penaeus vannamei]|uniref:uncharacterized protein n=1 Tax=Penaeus vannamei TaxID=6689 RepID=UPI00387F9628